MREAAEKATSGKWERGDGNGNGGELLVYCDDALGSAICEMTSEYNAIPKYQRINNLNFIAAANPATVLALLDELEAKDKQIADYQELISGLVGVSSSILREVERINKDAAAGKGEAS
ncbi:ead/Ea22-like family protein [Enterobacter cancerogenus]